MWLPWQKLLQLALRRQRQRRRYGCVFPACLHWPGFKPELHNSHLFPDALGCEEVFLQLVLLRGACDAVHSVRDLLKGLLWKHGLGFKGLGFRA